MITIASWNEFRGRQVRRRRAAQIINADAIHGYDDMGTKAHSGGERNEEHCGNHDRLGGPSLYEGLGHVCYLS